MPHRPRFAVPRYRISLSGVLVAALSLLPSCSKDSPEEMRGFGGSLPSGDELNYLVISFDALRADALGLYGYHRETSPNLDRFAEGAIVFEHAYTAAPVTPTSFAAAFSGQYPYRSFLGWTLMPTTTLAGLMRESGRSTFGLFNNVQLAEERNFGQGFDIYEVRNGRDEDILERTRGLLEQHRDRKFFGWVHFISPHTPYEFREMSAHLAPLLSEGRYAREVPANHDVTTDEELGRVRKLYDGEVFFADHLFGQVVEALETLDLIDHTVIVVTADHGEEFMEHGRLGHKSLYEGVVRIPMLIRHPGMDNGHRSLLPYLNIDLLPTLAGMAGLEPPEGLDGIDLSRSVPAERDRILTAMTNARQYGIATVSGDAKFIVNCTPEYSEELYDLGRDRAERSNRILDDPGAANELAGQLESRTGAEPCKMIRNSSRGRAPEDLLSPEQVEQLRSLGYIQ